MITYESNIPPCMKVILDDFNEALTSLTTLGYFLIESELPRETAADYNRIPEPSLGLIWRTIAKQMRRPFVRVHKNIWYGYARDVNGALIPHPDGKPHRYKRSTVASKSGSLAVPRRKYLSPIINPLMLVAKDGPRYGYNSSHPVTYWSNTKDFYFKFHGDAGFEILNDYLEQMNTREEMRAALFHTTRNSEK